MDMQLCLHLTHFMPAAHCRRHVRANAKNLASDQPELAEQYVRAFEKVWAYRKLLPMQP
jgi:hypothetical protein